MCGACLTLGVRDTKQGVHAFRGSLAKQSSGLLCVLIPGSFHESGFFGAASVKKSLGLLLELCWPFEVLRWSLLDDRCYLETLCLQNGSLSTLASLIWWLGIVLRLCFTWSLLPHGFLWRSSCEARMLNEGRSALPGTTSVWCFFKPPFRQRHEPHL